jgi:hypothetical protein
MSMLTVVVVVVVVLLPDGVERVQCMQLHDAGADYDCGPAQRLKNVIGESATRYRRRGERSALSLAVGRACEFGGTGCETRFGFGTLAFSTPWHWWRWIRDGHGGREA